MSESTVDDQISEETHSSEARSSNSMSEHRGSSQSTISDTGLGENASLPIDEGMEDDGFEDDEDAEPIDEEVVVASMQFSLNTSNSAKLDCESNKECAIVTEENPSSGPKSNGIPIKVNRHRHVVDTAANAEEKPPQHIETSHFPVPDEDVNDTSESNISEELDLPKTVTLLTCPWGTQVYLVGTAHFSRESQDDVATTIEKVHPSVVMVELCKSRIAVLSLDEETILNEAKSLNFRKMRIILQQHGNIQGVLYLLLLSVSAHITKQLGMAPGGEFRTAFSVARRTVPGCVLHLGDRPIHITLSRALSSLNVWQKLKLLWHILASKEPISKEEVERCKQKDFIEEMLVEMTGQFPGISEVFVKERDIYLTKSLQASAAPRNGYSPRAVVGVVGIGHVSGIVERWGKVTEDDIRPIMIIPPPNMSDRILKATFKITFFGLLGFGVYKCLPTAFKSQSYTYISSSLNLLKSKVF